MYIKEHNLNYQLSNLNFDVTRAISGTVSEPFINGNIDISCDQLIHQTTKLSMADNQFNIKVTDRPDNPQIAVGWNCAESAFESFKFKPFVGSVGLHDSLLYR